MGSPPFQVEDQTDEDFFDKLVDDEFGGMESVTGLAEGDDSDEVKAFSNLSMGEVDSALEDSDIKSALEDKGEKHGEDIVATSSDAPEEGPLVVEESVSLVSSSSLAFDNVIESSDAVMATDVATYSTRSNSSGSTGTGVKEVQWNLFNTDSTQESVSGFGSYSDFFNELGDSSVDPFEKAADNPKFESNPTSGIAESTTADLTMSFSYAQHQEGQAYGAAIQQTTDGQDLNSSQYWENLYPGWRYDPNTGEWHQLDGYDATANIQENFDVKPHSAGDGVCLDQRSEVSYLQQTADQSIVGAVAEGGTTESVSSWNKISEGNTEYPAHMLFDPQYPGWYYDTIAQEWRLLESYTPAVQSTSTAHYLQNQNGNALTDSFIPDKDNSVYGEYGQVDNFGSRGLGSQDQGRDWAGSVGNYNQQSMNMWQPETVAKSDATSFTENQQVNNLYGSRGPLNSYTEQQTGYKPTETVSLYEQTNQNYDSSNRVVGGQRFVPADNFSKQLNQPKMEQSQQMHFPHDYYGSQKSVNLSQQSFQSGTQFSHGPNEQRSSAGRPPHALVTFGFGGKLIVMKDNSSFLTNSAYGSQDSVGGSVSIVNLMEVVMDKTDASSIEAGACDYFRTLCQQSFPGPLVGGNVGSRELNKWIDERIANCESPNMDYRKGKLLRLLLSLLKIACQHYGKLRSPFGTDPALRESDRPESAVAELFASAKRNGAQLSGYGDLTYCLQNLPSEGQIRATAVEVQNLLVSGRKKEALQSAQEGQLWGPALVLAAQLGDQFYVETVKQMALRQLVAGSPLRTLCLLIAGQPADVFSADTTTSSGFPGAVNLSQQPVQLGARGMLEDWEENLAIITANRTKDDELVIVHLGDSLWKERGEITAAHICYLVAEANFESYSDSARLCLIGADHWKFPRTYASPEAVQMTEIYEYAMLLGNSQFMLLPFQPYKLFYAHMLAELGKVSDSLKYCQAILKSVKTGRAPEVDMWKQLASSLEERIRTHQQGGYATNLAPAKLVGKLLTFFDSTAHRVVGGPPPPMPSTSHSSIQSIDQAFQPVGPRVSNSQSTMTMSSLMPSASMEPISERTGDSSRRIVHNRSISEPDFGRSPRQGNQSKEATSSDAQGKASISGGPSRFGRFGSQLFQKTMGLVLRSRPGHQAKLGEENKFYYDEKLKRWVEEGTDPPAEEAALPPPPTTAAFQNGVSDYNLKNAFNSEKVHTNGGPEIKSPTPLERSSGIPPIPPSSNQFSARGRMGVRSRYVDTFNKGGGTPANLFQSPSVPAVKPEGGANAKFFIPTPEASGRQTVDAIGENMQEAAVNNEDPSTSIVNNSFSTPPPSSVTMQRFPSMDNIMNKGMGVTENSNGSLSSRSRRTASWSGSFSDAFNPKMTKVKPLGEALGMPPSSFMPSDLSSMHLPVNGSRFGDELHEVEL
ncbi:hypothetical protein HHK36_027990 [Tetracentron sinense]|uniref:Protein transport protein sec16 n=1 Tax=Tetracentron sinense TaxID=13715 RepID=A0A835D4X3_TETSI|nr:hypothetical protein HHK36_027990 [Tetracentron sinense]